MQIIQQPRRNLVGSQKAVRLQGVPAGVTPQELAAELARTEESLQRLRATIISGQVQLRAAGKLEEAVNSFNRQRSTYAQLLTGYTARIKAEYENLDQLQGDLSFGLWKGKRAQKFDQELVARLGSADPGLALLDRLPPIRFSQTKPLAGLGALPAAALVVLAVGAASLAVGVAIRIADLSLFSAAAPIREQADRERAFLDAIVACNGNAACIAAVGSVDPNKPPETKTSLWPIVIIAAGAAALWFFWPKIVGKVVASRGPHIAGVRRRRLR